MFKSFKIDLTDFSKVLDELLSEAQTVSSDTELEIHLPGLVKDSIDITPIPNGRYTVLYIKAKDKKGREISTERWIHKELDAEQTKATYEDGVLTIKFKPKESKESKIKVE